MAGRRIISFIGRNYKNSLDAETVCTSSKNGALVVRTTVVCVCAGGGVALLGATAVC